VFTEAKENKSKVNNLYVQSVDLNTLKPAAKTTKLVQINYSGKLMFNAGNFSTEVSPDSNKILIYYNTPDEKGSPEKFGLNVYDAGMNSLWTKEITLPYNDELFGVQDFILDNDGNVAIVGKKYSEKGARELIKGVSNVTYMLLTYSDKGSNENKAELKLKNLFINKIKVQYDQDRNVFVSAGFYSKEAGSNNIAGLFFAEYDEKGNIVTLDNKDFSPELLTLRMRERKQEKTKKKIDEGEDVEMSSYVFDYFKPIPGGGMLVTAEQFYITTTVDAKGNTHTVYHYNDILAAKISEKGEIAWMAIVPKTQSGGGPFPYFSYAPAIVNDKVYLIFNDHEENLSYTSGPPARTPGPGSSIVCVAEIDGEGRTHRYPLISNRDLGLNMYPKVCRQVKSGEIQLFAQKKKKQVIGSVKLD
jgi:hypothetical protein